MPPAIGEIGPRVSNRAPIADHRFHLIAKALKRRYVLPVELHEVEDTPFADTGEEKAASGRRHELKSEEGAAQEGTSITLVLTDSYAPQ